MAEMLAPLEWNRGSRSAALTPADAVATTPIPLDSTASGSGRDKLSREAFRWPAPPFASYHDATAHTDPLPCEIVGLNDVATHGRLTFFVPDEGVAHVQLPPARTTITLRFDQFRSLTLNAPLAPIESSATDPHAGLLAQRTESDYELTLGSGITLRGKTVGHVQADYGLFLFPPLDAKGTVRRMFVPKVAYEHFELGSKIGQVLVEQRSATSEQIEQAVDMQQQLRHRRLGDILVNSEVLTAEQLLDAIERQAKMPMVRIGEALLSLGMITDSQLQVALAQQHGDRSVPLGELLVRMGVVSREDLQVALSRKMGYPLVDIDSFPAEVDALRKLSFPVAMRLRAMPLLVRDGRLIVALEDPARRRAAVEEIEFSAQMKTVLVLAQCRSLETVLQAAYESIGAAHGYRAPNAEVGVPLEYNLADTDQLVQTLEKEGSEQSASDDSPIEQSDNSLVRLLNNMIIQAHKDGVSDIHIESYPGREKIRVRFRKDGLLQTYLELPPNYRNALIARVKIMCELDISERRKPQDGKINFARFSPAHRLELRVATVPTNNGLEDVVMRILASAKPIPVDRLGLSSENLERLKFAVERPYGLVLCVGPTGSGKTTTLHSAISHVNVPERKIWTAEDPVEITQPGLRQVQVNPRIDWTFAKALRAFLRADPDIIMVGEIRDTETAHMAVEASLTGHLVLSTLHTNSAPETVTRLLDMGLDPFNFADSLLAVLAQRLVRRLCTECRSSRPLTAEEQAELLEDYMRAFGPEPPVSTDEVLARWKHNHGRDGQLMRHHSPGCAACDRSGFRGRAGLHEMLVISRELRRLVQTGGRAEALQHVAMSQGMRTLRQDGIDKVLAGITTIDEVRSTSNL